MARVQHEGGGESLTKQSMASATDINNIVNRWIVHGEAPVTGKKPMYGDFTGLGDFHTAMNRVKAAEADFQALPAHIRKHCNNDPGEFLAMVYDPNRKPELEQLGLVESRNPAVPEPEPAPENPAPE